MALGTAMAAAGAACAQSPAPPTVFDLNFGKTPMTAQWSGSMALKNDGEKPLRVQQVLTSCRCVSAEVTNAPIPPGETAEVTITLDLQGLAGHIEQEADLYLEGGQTKEVIIRVQGDIIPAIQWSASSLDFNGLAPGETRAQIISITAADQRPLNVSPHAIPGFRLVSRPTATGAEVAVEAHERELPFRIPAGAESLICDITGDPSLHPQLPVSWSRAVPAKVTPEYLLFTAGGAQTQVIRLQRSPDRPWALKALKIDPKAFQARVLQDRGTEVQVEVTRLPGAGEHGVWPLSISISDPFVGDILVPVRTN
jgi:hypothetical protein